MNLSRRAVVPTGLVVGFVATLYLQRYGTGYQVAFLVTLFINIGLAYSWNLISGYTGYLSFGHVAFFGIGAYTVAVTGASGGGTIPVPMAVLLAGILCAAIAVPVGLVMLRLRGPYFAIGMLAVAEIARLTATELAGITGGGAGTYAALADYSGPVVYSLLAVVVAHLVLTYWLENSRFGLRLLSIREDEEAAESIGVDTTRTKLVAFCLSAVGPGVIGGLYGLHIAYIDPESVFSLRYTINMVLMTIVGGSGTILGPLLGATFVTAAVEPLWARYPSYYLALSGMLVAGTVLVLPGGLVVFLQRLRLVPRVRPHVSRAGDDALILRETEA